MSRMSRRDFLGGRFRPRDAARPGAEEGGFTPSAPDGSPVFTPLGESGRHAPGAGAGTDGLTPERCPQGGGMAAGPTPEGGPGYGGLPVGVGLPPEFTPALLRAEAGRLGLDAERLTPGELAAAILKAMYARAPTGPGRPDKRAPAEGGGPVF